MTNDIVQFFELLKPVYILPIKTIINVILHIYKYAWLLQTCLYPDHLNY